jgi:uncharacterized protein (DUF2225 family)
MTLQNKNLEHLKNIVSEKRYWTYERMYEKMRNEARDIVGQMFGSRADKNRNLNWLEEKYFNVRAELNIEDVKEKYFSKRLIQSTIISAKTRMRKRIFH